MHRVPEANGARAQRRKKAFEDRLRKHAIMDIESGMLPKVLPKLSINERKKYGICIKCGRDFSQKGSSFCIACLESRKTDSTYWKKREE